MKINILIINLLSMIIFNNLIIHSQKRDKITSVRRKVLTFFIL